MFVPKQSASYHDNLISLRHL